MYRAMDLKMSKDYSGISILLTEKNHDNTLIRNGVTLPLKTLENMMKFNTCSENVHILL